MSCVCAIAQKGRVYMASDSIGCADNYVIQRKDPKIFRNGQYLIGYCGSVRCGQVLQPHYFTPPDDILDLPDAIMAQYEEKGCLGIGESGVKRFEALLAIGYKGKCYYIMSDFQLGENEEDFIAIGSGQEYALSALWLSRSHKDPVFRLKKSIQAAAYFCTEVGGKIEMLILDKED